MTPRRFYTLQQSGREADLYIFGDIVTERWSEQETSAHSLAQQLKETEADVINVYIDSYGGAVSEGWAIYNQLRQHPARVWTYGTGFVASAALYPFLAGDERYAVEPSAYYLHQVMASTSGSAEDLRSAADLADQMTEIGLAPFRQAGVDVDAVREMMQRETWLSPQEALACGIATSVLTTRPQTGVSQSAKDRIIGSLLQKAREPKTPPQNPQSTPDPEPNPEPMPPSAGIMQLLGGIIKL